jgi:hypothetical protein
MNKADHKMTVFTALTKAEHPLTSAQLLSLLDKDIPSRSLRRWLQELVTSGAVEKIGEKRGARYVVRSRESTDKKPLIFSQASNKALRYVAQPIYLREPVPYDTDFLSSYIPNTDFYLTEEQRSILMMQGQRSQFGSMAGTYARHIYNRLLIDLSFNSSRLEGNTYSLIDTEKLLISGIKDESKLTEETTMIINHKEAIRYLVNNASKISISPELIYTLHYLIADGLLSSESCGVLRNHSVKIGGSNYLPIESREALENLLKMICEKAAMIQDPFEQSFFVLVHLAYLQGFEDCNKRTSRLSANISLIQKNLVPLSFNDIPKDEYINAMLAIYELNDIHPLADLYCFSYLRTCQIYDATVQVIGFDRLRVLYREQRREIIRGIITEKLHGDAMQNYIIAKTQSLIPSADYAEFVRIIQEDIALLSIPRIAGMGIAIAEFNAWKSGE